MASATRRPTTRARLQSEDQQQSNYALVTLSQSQALRSLALGYIVSETAAIYKRIAVQLRRALFERRQHAYSWSEALLARALHHVTAYLARTRFTAAELQAKQVAATARLRKIEYTSQTVMAQLDQLLDNQTTVIAGELLAYLSSEGGEARCRMGAWQLQQLPYASGDQRWAEVEARLDRLTEARLVSVMCEWDSRHQLILGARRALLVQFKREFFVIENELETIEHIMESNHWSFADNAVESDAKMMEFSSWVDTNPHDFRFKRSALQKLSSALRE